ncbi:peptide ABC transporter permease [Ralstonia solanacearum]|uniref:peptide ABC transporter permease n=1 Tax=Ralstonia solanacearum TaxID=305 RepID=UPI000E66CF50|nr:peptide ABC transporter permease [Ralstonia solanacearum]RIJ85281.1 peptide ABC transporter permease [Ralstonia solanacearum]
MPVVGISALAYALRVRSASLPKSVALGHAQQLVAAALGYKSLAAYQASQEERPDLSGTKHIVIDELLLQRAQELSVGYAEEILVTLLSDTFKQALPAVQVHRNEDALNDALRAYVDNTVLNDDNAVSEMTMSNGTLGEVYLPFETSLADIPFEDVEEFRIHGHVGMQQDPERPYVGHIVRVDASLFLTRYGRVCVGPVECTVNSAKLRWYGDDDHDEEEPTQTLAQALASELGIGLEEAETLVDAEILPNESNDGGLVYSHILYAEHVASPELAKKLLDKFGTLSIELPANFYDGVHWSPYD